MLRCCAHAVRLLAKFALDAFDLSTTLLLRNIVTAKRDRIGSVKRFDTRYSYSKTTICSERHRIKYLHQAGNLPLRSELSYQ